MLTALNIFLTFSRLTRPNPHSTPLDLSFLTYSMSLFLFCSTAALKNPFQIVIRSFLLTSALACAYPKMLGPLVLGRLLPFAAGSRLLRDFINDVYEKGEL